MDKIIQLDQSLFHLINNNLSNHYFDVFFPWITDLHKTLWFQLTVYPLVLFFFLFKFKKKGVLVFICCLFSLGTSDLVGNWLFKKNVQRLRPGDNPAVHAIVRAPYSGYSFTSNHATNMFCFAFFMSLFVGVWRWGFFLLAMIVAFSRVYNGVHFPLDVICGGLLGISIAYLYRLLTNKYILKNDYQLQKANKA